MRYCQSCEVEYPDLTQACPTCQGPLVDAPPRETRRFVLAGTAEDPLTAENLAEVVDQAGIPVVVRARRRGVVDPITSPALHAWWEILVPEELAERAQALVESERANIEADAGAAERAALEEEQATEKAAQRSAEGRAGEETPSPAEAEE
jgi:hypothetical protein